MAILFLVALVLAWPTFGLSIVAWFVVAAIRGHNRHSKNEQRRSRATLLAPMFNGRYAEFFEALDIPRLYGSVMMEDDADSCGRHIVNYIAHNPEESFVFSQGLMRWRTKGGSQLCDPILAAETETLLDEKAEIHLVSYRAIEALMINNRSLRCFHSIDLGQVVAEIARIELSDKLGGARFEAIGS